MESEDSTVKPKPRKETIFMQIGDQMGRWIPEERYQQLTQTEQSEDQGGVSMSKTKETQKYMPLRRLLSLAVQSVVFFISSLYLAGLTYLLIRATQNGSITLRSDALMTLRSICSA